MVLISYQRAIVMLKGGLLERASIFYSLIDKKARNEKMEDAAARRPAASKARSAMGGACREDLGCGCGSLSWHTPTAIAAEASRAAVAARILDEPLILCC